MKEQPSSADSAPLWRRLGWMAVIWGGSVLFLSLIAMVIRFWLS